jgi:hypothetical protein
VNGRSRPKAAPETPAKKSTDSLPPASDNGSDDALFDVAINPHAYGVSVAFAERDHALEHVEQAGDDWSRSVVDKAIVETGRRLGEFSANDVRHLLPEVRRSLIGARFLALSKQGRLQAIGYVPSTDRATHGSPIRLWWWIK